MLLVASAFTNFGPDTYLMQNTTNKKYMMLKHELYIGSVMTTPLVPFVLSDVVHFTYASKFL
jgi:hypothetical protein